MIFMKLELTIFIKFKSSEAFNKLFKTSSLQKKKKNLLLKTFFFLNSATLKFYQKSMTHTRLNWLVELYSDLDIFGINKNPDRND